MIFSPYTTSNENIAYPLLPSDAIAYKDQDMASVVTSRKIPTSFLVAAIFNLDVDSLEIYTLRASTLVYSLTLKDNNGNIFSVLLPVTVEPYKQWYPVSTIYSIVVGYILPGSGYTSYMEALRSASPLFPISTVYVDPSIIYPGTPAVTDFELDDEAHTVISPTTGIVKIQAGYNIGLTLQSVEDSRDGDTLLSAFEAVETGISVEATSAAGEGRIPCDQEPVQENQFLRRLSGASGDANGNVVLRTDECYRIEPDLQDQNALVMTGDCKACCECEDYYDALTYLRKQFNYDGQLSVSGFSSEYNTTPQTLFYGAASESDLTLKYERVGGYALHYLTCTLKEGGIPYTRWEYRKNGVVAYYSTATTNSYAPLGVLWYSYDSVNDPYGLIYKDKVSPGTSPEDVDPTQYYVMPSSTAVAQSIKNANVFLYISTLLPVGLWTAKGIMDGLYNGNKESYSNSVSIWNAASIAGRDSASVTAWLTVGSRRMNPLSPATELKDLSGFNHAVLNTRVLTLVSDTEIVWMWAGPMEGTIHYNSIRDTYFYLNTNFNLMTGPIGSLTPFARVSILRRSGADPALPWDVEFGVAHYSSPSAGFTGSALTVIANGITYTVLPSAASDLGGPTMFLEFLGDTAILRFSVDVAEVGVPNGVHRWTLIAGGVTYTSPESSAPLKTVVGGTTYYIFPPPWAVSGAIVRPASTSITHAEVGSYAGDAI